MVHQASVHAGKTHTAEKKPKPNRHPIGTRHSASDGPSDVLPDGLLDVRAVGGLIYEVRRNWKVSLVVGVGYVVVGGAEAVLAGSVVGALYVFFSSCLFCVIG